MRPDWPRTLGLPALAGAVAGAHHPHPQALTHLQLRESRGSWRSQGAGLCRDPILWGGAPHLGEPCPAGGLTPPPRGQTFSRLTGRREGCPGQREQEAWGSGERGVRTAEAGAGRAPLWEEDRAPSCFPRPRPPAQGPVALHPDRGLAGECDLRGSCPSPPRPRLPKTSLFPPH